MRNLKFDRPLTVRDKDSNAEIVISDVPECSAFLLRQWQGKRGPAHRAAVQACHDATTEAKPASNVRKAFAVAAREAGILVNP